MTDPIEILRAAHHVVVQDYPSESVPAALVRAGLQVTVYGGPEPDDVYALVEHDGEVVSRRTGRPPESADVLSTYRPLAELPAVVAEARRLGVRAVWRQIDDRDPGSDDPRWRQQVEAAGISYVDQPPIAEAALMIAAAPEP